MSDRIVVMHGGVADQVGTPFEIYNQPATRFVAQFVGTLNTLTGKVVDTATGGIRLAGQDITLGRPLPAGPVTLAARPEAISLTQGDLVMPALITGVDFLGSVIRITALAGGETLAFDTFNSPSAAPPHIGAEVDLRLNAQDLLVLSD
jgi:putative spermidine/putrescine transport system ATP-binding protein